MSTRDNPPPDVHFGYYLLQLRTERVDAERRIGGVLEDLRTGERLVFEGLDALNGILDGTRQSRLGTAAGGRGTG